MSFISHPLERIAFDKLRTLSEKERVLLMRKVEVVAKENGFLHRLNSKQKAVSHPIALTPFIIPKAIIPKFKSLAKAVYKFQLKLPNLYEQNTNNIQELLPLDEQTKYWLRFYQSESQNKKLLIRLDLGFGISKNKSLYPIIFENNSVALAGLYNHSIGVDLLKSLIFSLVFSPKERQSIQDPPDLLDFVYKWVMNGNRSKPNVAFVESFPIEKNYGEIPRITENFFQRGIKTSYGHPIHLKIKGKKVVLGNTSVDFVYRDLAYRHLRSTAKEDLRGFKTLLKQSKVAPGFSAEFSHKGILECFTSRRYHKFFTQKERKLFKVSVPWTRVIWDRRTEDLNGESIDLISYIKKHKNNLVIKPNLDAGGTGVVFGKDANWLCWNGLIKKALEKKGAWIVQRAVNLQTKSMVYLKNSKLYFSECYFTFGVFYYPDEVGLHCRISPFKTANVARGGSLACVFVEK